MCYVLTFKGAGNVGLPDVIVLRTERLARGRWVCYLPPGEGTEVVGYYGDRGARTDVCSSKYARQVLVLLRIELLGRNQGSEGSVRDWKGEGYAYLS